MSEEFEYLIRTLKKSIEKNGPTKVITLEHLLNILLKVQQDLELDDFLSDMEGCKGEIE